LPQVVSGLTSWLHKRWWVHSSSQIEFCCNQLQAQQLLVSSSFKCDVLPPVPGTCCNAMHEAPAPWFTFLIISFCCADHGYKRQMASRCLAAAVFLLLPATAPTARHLAVLRGVDTMPDSCRMHHTDSVGNLLVKLLARHCSGVCQLLPLAKCQGVTAQHGIWSNSMRWATFFVLCGQGVLLSCFG
jgi:hypothetical protein